MIDIGSPAPDFTLETPDGSTSLADYKLSLIHNTEPTRKHS